jgi:hypothetical protein
VQNNYLWDDEEGGSKTLAGSSIVGFINETTYVPGGGQGGQKPGGGSSGGAGAGDPPPGTIFRPEKLPENHPCNGIAISDLNFYASRLPTKDDRRSKNGMEHIIFGHVNPIHSKMAAKKSQFIMSISPSAPLVKEQSLIEVGQAVFYYGGTPKENPQNKNWVITARFPQIFDGGVVKFIIGVGPQKTGGQSVDEVTLVLKPDCKGVVTMHPGTSGASGVPVGNIPPSAVIRTGAVIFNKP